MMAIFVSGVMVTYQVGIEVLIPDGGAVPGGVVIRTGDCASQEAAVRLALEISELQGEWTEQLPCARIFDLNTYPRVKVIRVLWVHKIESIDWGSTRNMRRAW
jgi:hypothetical protein